MKRLKYFLLMVIIIPINTFAIEFYCDRNVKSNSTFSCTISNSSNSLYNFVANLDYSNEFIVKKEIYSNEYTNNGSVKNINIIGPGFNAPTTIAIITFLAPTVSSNQNYTISLKNIKYKYLSSETNFRDNQSDLTVNITVSANTTTAAKPVASTTTTTKAPSTTTTTTTKNNQNSKLKLILNYMVSDRTDEFYCASVNGKCSINLSNIDKPAKDGYKFIGWDKSTTCNNYKVYTEYIISSDEELYACYEANTSEDIINYLDSINIKDYNIGFNKYIFNYTIDISGDMTSLDIDAIPLNQDAKVIISDNAKNLVDGKNKIEISVIYNDVTTTYTINVNKNYSDKPKINNITINGYNFIFNQDIYEYNLLVKYGTTNLDVLVDCDDDYTYTISGNTSISNGSKILIVAKSESSEDLIYTINIKYDSFIKSYLPYIYGVSFGLFCIIVYFVVKYLRSDKFKLKEEKKKVKETKIEPKKENIVKKEKKSKKEKKIKEKKKAKEEQEEIIEKL